MVEGDVHPGTVVRAVCRIYYSEALTLGWSSVLFVLGSLPLVTIGASLIALVEIWITVVSTESSGKKINERELLVLFAKTWFDNILAGIPYSLAFLLVGVGSFVYLALGTASGSGIFLLWTLVSFYVVVVVLGWEFRAASIRMRSSTINLPGFRETMERAAYSLIENPWYSILQFAWFGVILFLLRVFPPAFIILGPAVLAISEIVGFEELFGDGAETIRAAYAR